MWGISLLLLNLFGHLEVVIADQRQIPLAGHNGLASIQTFTLRHVFYHDLKDPDSEPAVFTNILPPSEQQTFGSSQLSNLAKSIRARFDDPFSAQAESLGRHGGANLFAKSIPDVKDKATVINLAMMSSDVYLVNGSDTGWLNLTQGFNDSLPFGYDEDGLRGHLFANADNSTVIVAFKGSTLDPRETTRNKDKENDNILFSCCCASQRPDPYPYGKVCSCRQDVYRCNSTCLTAECSRKDRYYAAAVTVMNNVTQDLYPDAAIWTTGHSLGGSIASLMGLKFDVPAVSFEAPPDAVPARRLGLYPIDTETRPRSAPLAYHFGNSADPVYMGACNGFWSSCAALGYAFESQCFTGKRCMYDTMTDKGWRLHIGHHRIVPLIEDILKVYDDVPECIDEDEECVDCFNWNFH